MSELGMKDSKSGKMLALRGVEVSARIAGLLASTTLLQKYKNDSQTNLELSYTFPVPVSGTLLSFAVTISDRKYDGQVIPRTQAEVKYEETIGEGDSAFRLQEIRAGMYNVALGNIMPGETVDITLAYVESLAWNGKGFRYRLPTTIAPRYGEPTGMQPWQRPETSLIAEYPLNVTVSIAGELAQSAVSCPSHKVSVKILSDCLTVQLANGAFMDRDFILEIDNEAARSLGTMANAWGTNIAMLTLLPPEVKDHINQRDVILVIDCSGSMQGDSLALAREGILLALGSLEPNDYFGLIAFGSSILHFSKELQPANRKNLDMARRWACKLPDLGGTEINSALEFALQMKRESAMDILLLTDGQDWAVGGSVAKAKAEGVRIFSMGIGSAVAEESVRMMADETGGASELIAPTEDMSERIYRHFKRMRQPQMRELEIAWPGSPLWECRPARACFAGDAYTVFAALPERTARDVVVRFAFSEQPTQSMSVPLCLEDACSDAIVRLAAKERLSVMDKEQRQSWAVSYQLISSYTDFLITVQRSAAEKAKDLPLLQTQVQMLPAGWGGTSSVDMLQGHSSFSYSAMLEVPAVLRMSRRKVSDLKNNGYNKFIEKLNHLSRQKDHREIPVSIYQLYKLPLPTGILQLIMTLMAEGVAEDVVIQSLYSALLQHSGHSYLNEKLTDMVIARLNKDLIDPEVSERLFETLEKLFDECAQDDEHLDVPAFLRSSIY